MSYALTLKAARVEKNLSQSQLSYITQISQTTISHLENGVHKPQAGTKQKIEEIVGAVDWARTFDHGQIQRQILTN